ncbi:MAG TPA: PAS domain S-box protein, partial [Burkholderiaceae bacterium]|nr:PAS domain S-box protein [Burkholderiaceae bacterium]
DGTRRNVLPHPQLIHDANGQVVGAINMLVDVTDSQPATVAQARLAAIIESSEDAILSKTLEGRITSWNAGAERIFGYTSDEAVGQPITMLIPPERLAEEQHILQRLRQRERVEHFETVRCTKDGRRIQVSLAISPVFDQAGCVIGASKIVRDITASKQAAEALRISEQIYRAIGESNDYGVWVCDPEGRNTYASPSFLNLVGLTQQECSDLGWSSVLHPDDVERTVTAWQECVRTGSNWDIELRYRGVDGEWHPVLARGVPVRNDRGEVTAWAGINLDISRSKQVEHDLRVADRRKDEFLAVLAHELRNPLAPICAGLELMRLAGDDPSLFEEVRATMERQTRQ